MPFSSIRYVYFAEKGVTGVTGELLNDLVGKLREEMQNGLEAGTDEAEQVGSHFEATLDHIQKKGEEIACFRAVTA